MLRVAIFNGRPHAKKPFCPDQRVNFHDIKVDRFPIAGYLTAMQVFALALS